MALILQWGYIQLSHEVINFRYYTKYDTKLELSEDLRLLSLPSRRGPWAGSQRLLTGNTNDIFLPHSVVSRPEQKICLWKNS